MYIPLQEIAYHKKMLVMLKVSDEIENSWIDVNSSPNTQVNHS
jgi:hypothetical protein